MPDTSVPITAGAGTNIDTFTTPSGDHRQVMLLGNHGGYTGRASTFRIPGRAGTTGQKLMSIHNATGSSVVAEVQKIWVDTFGTAAKAVTVIPPIVRVYKVTVLPTNGTALTKVAKDSGSTASSASVTLLQDASADGTGSATALTATLPAGAVVASVLAPRMITAAGYEMIDRVEFLSGQDESVILRPLEGLVVSLDYTVATANPTSDHWVAGVHWEEYVA